MELIKYTWCASCGKRCNVVCGYCTAHCWKHFGQQDERLARKLGEITIP